MGKLVGDDVLQCHYHGLRFDGSGACVHQPYEEGEPAPHNCVRSWPVVEQGGFVWLWAGEAERAEHVVLHRLARVRLHHRHVLVRRRVGHQREVLCLLHRRRGQQRAVSREPGQLEMCAADVPADTGGASQNRGPPRVQG